MFRQDSNYKQRRFQTTGFGLDRNVLNNNNLPIWKKQMFNRIRTRSKQHRQSLLKRLERSKNNKNKNNRNNNINNNINNTIDSFKNALVEYEMKECIKYENEIDIELQHLSSEKYKIIFAELAEYLEKTELSKLRESYIKSLDEKEKDSENDLFEEIIANDTINNPYVVCCPICWKNQIEIEYVNDKQPIYSCLCGIKFQPRDKKVCIFNNNKNNIQVQVGQKMLKTLKNTLNNLMNYHLQQLHCNNQLNFAIINENGYLQCWCTQCNCNEVVI